MAEPITLEVNPVEIELFDRCGDAGFVVHIRRYREMRFDWMDIAQREVEVLRVDLSPGVVLVRFDDHTVRRPAPATMSYQWDLPTYEVVRVTRGGPIEVLPTVPIDW